MADKKASKKDVDVKKAAEAVEQFTIVKISGETYRKYEDGRLMNVEA
tara:strand:- start:1045 stop:1185 length:141 start_codon:yes stop_codon:yes gene_type:complete